VASEAIGRGGSGDISKAETRKSTPSIHLIASSLVNIAPLLVHCGLILQSVI
jgi:hypothetical protein